MSTPYPFSAIVAQAGMTQALLIAAVEPRIGGVLILGDRGTGKSTAVRGLAALLPKMATVKDCRYHCDPHTPVPDCPSCGGQQPAKSVQAPVPVVDLPLGASEDRIVGALDLEQALVHGRKSFEPGLLASAHRGFLYIDEVNLLEDHLVDLLLDVAASGENVVEREGLSLRHPARFVLVGSGNPEEGELRPQLLDRFGLAVDVSTPQDVQQRMQVIRRRTEFEDDPAAFVRRWQRQEGKLRRNILNAREALDQIAVPDAALERAAQLCMALGTDGLRGELTLIRAARAIAALDAAESVGDEHLQQAAPLALRHRLRRDPLDESGSGSRVQRALDEVFA